MVLTTVEASQTCYRWLQRIWPQSIRAPLVCRSRELSILLFLGNLFFFFTYFTQTEKHLCKWKKEVRMLDRAALYRGHLASYHHCVMRDKEPTLTVLSGPEPIEQGAEQSSRRAVTQTSCSLLHTRGCCPKSGVLEELNQQLPDGAYFRARSGGPAAPYKLRLSSVAQKSSGMFFSGLNIAVAPRIIVQLLGTL